MRALIAVLPLTLAAALALPGCVSVPYGTEPGGIPGGSIGDPDDPRGPRLPPGTVRGSSQQVTRDQVCRGSVPVDWIAVDYVAMANCPTWRSGETRFNGAVIERHTAATGRHRMTVCADQLVPAGWRREGGISTGSGCRGADVPEGAPTSMTIRRVR